MKKVLLTSLMIIVTLGIVGYFLAQTMARGSQDNFFNRNIRPKISASPFWRSVFVFKDYGDARRDYLKSGAKIRFNLYYMEGIDVEPEMLEQMAAEINRLTGEDTSYRIVTTHIPYASNVVSDEIDQIKNKYEFGNSDGYSDAYVFILSEDAFNPELIGSTIEQNSMVIYNNAIKAFVGQNKQTVSPYVLSTILHEFGHLLGMEHTTESGCLMLEHAEEDHVPKRDPDDVITKFCESEVKQVEIIKQSEG